MADLRAQTAREAYDGVRGLFLTVCTVLFYVVFGIADAPWGILIANLALGALFWTLLLVVHELGHALVGALTGTVLRFDVGSGPVLIQTEIRGVMVTVRPVPSEGSVLAIVRGRRWWRTRRSAVLVAGVAAELLLLGVVALALPTEALQSAPAVQVAPFTMLLFTTLVGTGFNLLPGVFTRDGVELVTDGLGILETLSLSPTDVDKLRLRADVAFFVTALVDGDAEAAERMLEIASDADTEAIQGLRRLLPLARDLPPDPWEAQGEASDETRETVDLARSHALPAVVLRVRRAGGDPSALLAYWATFEPEEPLLWLHQAMHAGRGGDRGEALRRAEALLERDDLEEGLRGLAGIEAAWLAVAADARHAFPVALERLQALARGPLGPLARSALGAVLVASGRAKDGVKLLQAGEDGAPIDRARQLALLARGLTALGREAEADSALDEARRLDPQSPHLPS